MCVFLLQIATTRFARKCKGNMLYKNFGVEENKQKRFTEHPPRKNQHFWKYLTALCGFTFCRIYVTQQKGAFEAAVNLDILQKKFSHQG